MGTSPRIAEYPVLVIGTTNEAAEEYAKILRLDDYIVQNTLDKIQGIRMRAIVVTPGFILAAEQKAYEAMHPLHAAHQGLAMVTDQLG